MITTLFLEKESFKFSAGHFTLFSATERENLHGHNFTVGVRLTCEVIDNGMTFDYGLAKRAVEQLCRSLNETVLLPGNSRWLPLEVTPAEVTARFGSETLRFLPRDVTVLPVENITVEELASWFCAQLSGGFAANPDYRILTIRVHVCSGPGQGAEVERTLV